MGRRGGQKAAERWKTDPDGQYAQENRQRLQAANKRREISGKSTRLMIAAWFLDGYGQTGQWPLIGEAVDEFKVSERTVRNALQNAGISLPKGRRKRSGN